MASVHGGQGEVKAKDRSLQINRWQRNLHTSRYLCPPARILKVYIEDLTEFSHVISSTISIPHCFLQASVGIIGRLYIPRTGRVTSLQLHGSTPKYKAISCGLRMLPAISIKKECHNIGNCPKGTQDGSTECLPSSSPQTAATHSGIA